MSLIKKIMMSAVVLGLMGFGSEVWADKAGQVVSTLSFGGYQETDGEDTVSGSQLALGITVSVSDRWAVFSRLSDGSATGQRTISGNTYTLKSRMTTLSGGMQWSYPVDLNVDGDAELVPYVGAGVSLQHYQHDFAYPDSKVGSTSGNGVGPLFCLAQQSTWRAISS